MYLNDLEKVDAIRSCNRMAAKRTHLVFSDDSFIDSMKGVSFIYFGILLFRTVELSLRNYTGELNVLKNYCFSLIQIIKLSW